MGDTRYRIAKDSGTIPCGSGRLAAAGERRTNGAAWCSAASRIGNDAGWLERARRRGPHRETQQFATERGVAGEGEAGEVRKTARMALAMVFGSASLPVSSSHRRAMMLAAQYCGGRW